MTIALGVETTADLDFGRPSGLHATGVAWTSLAADATATVVVIDERIVDYGCPGVEIGLPISLGTVADRAVVCLPFNTLANFVDRVRAAQKDDAA